MIIWKNKKQSFALKIENLFTKDFGKMIRFLPCVDIWKQTDIFCLGFSWLFFSIEFWYGDLEDLI
jgi:hypothetical protein